MNWLSLGNGVPHLHVHLVPRPLDDARARSGRSNRRRSTSPPFRPSTRRSSPRRPPRCGRACRTERASDVELLAEGRTAEVFAYGEGRVLKLDRPEWNGLSVFEADRADGAGRRRAARRPAARHRHGRRPQRRGPGPGRRPVAAQVLTRGEPEERRRASPAASSRCSCAATRRRSAACPTWCRASAQRDRGERARRRAADGTAARCSARARRRRPRRLPLRLPSVQRAGRARRLGRHRLAHRGGGAVGGRPGPHPRPVGAAVDRAGRAVPACRPPRGPGPAGPRRRRLDAWVRVVAAARVAEGFEGEERAWLLRVASGAERLFA